MKPARRILATAMLLAGMPVCLAAQDGNSVAGYRDRGIAFWHQHQVENARQAFAALLHIAPDDSVRNLYWGQIQFADHNCPAAIKLLTEQGDAAVKSRRDVHGRGLQPTTRPGTKCRLAAERNGTETGHS